MKKIGDLLQFHIGTLYQKTGLNLFFDLSHFEARCSYKIVLIKKKSVTCLPNNMFILKNFLLGRGPEEQKGNFLLSVYPSVRMSEQMSIPSL